MEAWAHAVRSLVPSEITPLSDSSTLQGRIEQLEQKELRRRQLTDYLAVAVEHSFASERLQMLGSAAEMAPGVPLPPNAVTLVRSSQQFPGQSARQMRAFVTESAPSDDASLAGRFDKLQAARLQMGAIQFGYFLSQVFRGQAELDNEQMLTPREAHELQARIQRATRHPRTELAWVVASRRSADFFALQDESEHASEDGAEDGAKRGAEGAEVLRQFTVGVQVVSSAQQEEFFAAGAPADDPSESATQGDTTQQNDGAGSAGGAEELARASSTLPTADFVRFHAAALQALLAESCLYGWHLWGAEAAAERLLQEATSAGQATDDLLQPPKHASSLLV